MVHPDYQYDPTLLPEVIRPIQEGRADVVLGSRLLGSDPVKQGMPRWTGYRAYDRDALEAVNLEMNSDNFIFDQEIIAQFVSVGMRIAEVPVPTRYFPEASSASFWQSTVYGLSILALLARYGLHRLHWMRQRQFESLRSRYTSVAAYRRHA
jgi:hypothetical protein